MSNQCNILQYSDVFALAYTHYICVTQMFELHIFEFSRVTSSHMNLLPSPGTKKENTLPYYLYIRFVVYM